MAREYIYEDDWVEEQRAREEGRVGTTNFGARMRQNHVQTAPKPMTGNQVPKKPVTGNQVKVPVTGSQSPQDWGKVGGRQAAANLSPEERSIRAKKAAAARWGKHETEKA